MSECNCHLSHPSYAGFIGNHSPMCPANREINTNCNMPKLIKAIMTQSPPAPERIGEEEISELAAWHENVADHPVTAKAIRQLQGEKALCLEFLKAPEVRTNMEPILVLELDKLLTKLGAK